MIGVVAHDAGGAEIVSSYLRRNPQPFAACLEGPASGIFARKFGEVETLTPEALVGACDWLLCGTSLAADLEWRTMRLARTHGKHCVAVLDHWINYRERFVRHGEECFPEKVWVGDAIALGIARRELSNVETVLVENPYFLDLREEFAMLPAESHDPDAGARILYLCEPLREGGRILYGNERYWGYTEEDALRYFLTHVDYLAGRIARITVRPHPKEACNKYAWAEQEFALPIVTGEDKTLLQQIAAADVVAGCATMAMVVALIAGKRVVSCIPPGGRAISLPFPGIESLDALMLRAVNEDIHR